MIVVLGGCTSAAQREAMVHGIEPFDYETTIMFYLDRNLKDPDSLKDFAILTEPRKGFLNYGAFEKGPTGKNFSNALWYVCIEYRAKNSFGAYTGLEQQAVFFFGESIVATRDGLTDGNADLGNTVFNCY